MSFSGLEPPHPTATTGTLQKIDCESLNTLIQQYDQALEENTTKKNEFQKYKDDYLKLKTRLRSLPDKLEYDAMVPLCSKALCPGKIVHTNEILCLLGDHWFVECTAKKAAEIVSHRIKSIDDTLNRLEKERELYNSWKFEAERQMVESLGEGTIEIMEEYDEEKEKEWKIQHRANVRKFHQNKIQEKQKVTSTSPVNTKGKTDAEFWTRLDALELEEEFMEAQAAYEEKISDPQNVKDGKMDVKIRQKPKQDLLEILEQQTEDDDLSANANSGKKVTFNPDNIIHNLSDLSIKDSKKRGKDHDDSEKEEVELYKPSEKSENGQFDPIFIRFRHGMPPLDPDKDELVDSDTDSDDDDSDEDYQIVLSPGDIYEQFGPPSLEAKTVAIPGADKAPLKSILKARNRNESEVHYLSRKEVRVTANFKAKKKSGDNGEKDAAIVPKVTERVPNAMGAMFPYMAPEMQPSAVKNVAAAGKPVSLFKKRKQGMFPDEDAI